MMKKTFAATALTFLSLLAWANPQTIFRSDFTKKTDPFRVWGAKLSDGRLVSNGKYDFGAIRLEPSRQDLTLRCTFRTEPETALGIVLYELKGNQLGKRLCRVVWGAAAPDEKTGSWSIKASCLTEKSLLVFYCINSKKGNLQLRDIAIETSSAAENPAAEPIADHGSIGKEIVLYQSDFTPKNIAPFMRWGAKLSDGVLVSNGKYDFGGIILPPSGQPYQITCTLKCDPGTAFGAVLFKVENGRRPGKRIDLVSWNKIKTTDFRTYVWKIDSRKLAESTFLIFYCINPKYGNITVKNLRIERIAEKLEIPELKKKPDLTERFTQREAESMLQLTDFMKFPMLVKSPAPERTDIFLGMTPQTLYGVAVLHHPGREKLKSSSHPRDDKAVFRDDSLEFFISAPGRVRPYYHFAFNASGALFDAMGDTSSWNSGFRSAAHPLGNSRTAIRFELPLKDIGYSEVEHNVLPANFGINFCRNHAGNGHSSWGKIGSGFHEPASFHRFHGFGKITGTVAASSHFSQVKTNQELDEAAYWKNEKTLFSELFSNEKNPFQGVGAFMWLTPVDKKRNTWHGLQYGMKFSQAEMLETLRKNNILPFCRYGEIPRYADWAKKNKTGLAVYFRYYRSDSFAWDLSDDSTMKRKLKELDALLTEYEGIIWGVELGDEALEVILGNELISLAGRPGGASSAEIQRVKALIRNHYGFGKYDLPKSLNSNDEPFSQLASRRFVLSKLQQMQKGIREVCRKHRGPNGKKVVAISPTQRADNILAQQSRQGEGCDIMTTQIVSMGNPWRQTIAFNTKMLVDLSGKPVMPCAHIENYHTSNNVETTAACISEIYRGGGIGMQLYLHDVVGSYNKMGSSYHCYYGHRPRWDKIMEEAKRFSSSNKLRFPKPDYAFFLSNDSAQSHMLFTEKYCEWLFNLLGPGAGSSFRFISDAQLTDGKIRLKDFPFVVLPAAPIQNRKVQQKFEEYVQNGGILICFDPKVFDHADDGSSTSAFREQLFGVVSVPHPGGKELSLNGYAGAFPLIGQKYALKPSPGVEVLGKTGNTPLITVKKYPGGGKAVMVSIGAEFYYAGQKSWIDLARKELNKLGASADQDIWKFSLPFRKETRPVFKGICRTGNHAFWHRNQFIPGPNRIPPGATYRMTLAPDGVKNTDPIPFGKGNLMNRLEAVSAGDMCNWFNDSLIKSGKLRIDRFADTWTDPGPFEIHFDFGEKIEVSELKIFWNGELPDLVLKFDDGTMLKFRGEKAEEVGEKILKFAPRKTGRMVLSLARRSPGAKLTIAEVEIW